MNKGLSQREHAHLAEELIDACGGIAEVVRCCRRATGKAPNKSQLSEYQSKTHPSAMPADLIDELELYCGKPTYSGALFDRFDTPLATGDLRESACDLAEGAAQLQATIRRTLAEGRQPTPRDFDNIFAAEAHAREALERLEGARRAAEIAKPKLAAV